MLLSISVIISYINLYYIFWSEELRAKIDQLKRESPSTARSDTPKVKAYLSSIDAENANDQYSNNFNMEIDFEQEIGQKCPYCSRNNLKSVNIHIGHVHKCKICKQLTWECKGHSDLH